MAISRFYPTTSSVDIAKDMMARESFVHCQKYEWIGQAVLNNTVPATSTLTPAVSPAWVVDAYNSTIAKNLLIVDDNLKVAAAKIADTIATALTFDVAACLLQEDGATAATFTNGATYDIYVLTPSSVVGGEYGPYLGDTEGLALNVNDELMEHLWTQPQRLRRTDLKRRTMSIEGSIVQTVNDDVFDMLFGAASYGLNTGFASRGIGSDNNFNQFYRFTFKSQDVESRDEILVVHKVQMSMAGNMFTKSASGHMALAMKGSVLADDFYPSTANMMLRVSED